MKETINHWIKSSISLKLAVIAFLTLLLLIPTNRIKFLITERESRSSETILEINSKWGNSQTLCGPILSVPYKNYYETEKGIKHNIRYAHFLPETLNIAGNIDHELRYRGIYNVIVYSSSLSMSGIFKKPDISAWDIENEDFMWNDAVLTIGISDLRGIKEKITVNWDQNKYAVIPGIVNKDVLSSGVTTHVDITNKSDFSYEINMDINGSDFLSFIPIGKETNIELNSDWNNPSFEGSFLPFSRNIQENGFNAKWHVLYLNRNYPQQWLGSNSDLQDSAFGVSLKLPVDFYQKITRSVKYALLFIALTFTVFFFVEVITKMRIHPIQYLLVGFGLVVFFSLLLALSEHLSFTLSYIISSTAVIFLLSFYVSSVLKNRKITALLSVLLIFLYSFLFTVLQIADFSLLIGNIGLFVILAIIMIVSRKINWYND